MDETTFPAGGTALADVPAQRSCTRCDGEQRLIGGMIGLGKYRCERCTMTVGFDLEAEPSEFLIDRGQPSRYTKDVFGSRLLGTEQRL